MDWHRSALRLLVPLALAGVLLFWKGNELLDSLGLGIACLMGFLGLAAGKWLGCLFSVGITVGIGMTLQRILASGQRGIWLFVGFLLLLAIWQYLKKQERTETDLGCGGGAAPQFLCRSGGFPGSLPAVHPGRGQLAAAAGSAGF